jgi:tRNA dimethylallyltransferase
VALEVVRLLNRKPSAVPIEVVCVDSMQVYRGMDIGTSKPSPADQAEVSHHLIDLVEPDDDFTVARFQAAAAAALGEIEARGHRALLVGGTGLYFQTVVDRLTPPGRYPQLRAQLEADADTAALHRRLSLADPLAASRILPANRRRVVRALEVTLGSGRPFSSFGPGIGTYPPTSFRIAGLWLPRPVVAGRIERRFAQMMAAGLLAEVVGLRDRVRGLSRTARQALGYRELLGHLEDGTPLEAAIDHAVRRTRAFARRQRVWWRRDPRITWYGSTENPLAVVPALLGDWSRT